MEYTGDTDRRTVLRTIGAGVVGAATVAGSAVGHPDDESSGPWVPAWFEDDIWELTVRPPAGGEPTETPPESHAPIYHIAPGAKPDEGYGCPQFAADVSYLNGYDDFADGPWGTVAWDQTAEHDPFSVNWHVHWVFEPGSDPYEPADMVNEAAVEPGGDPVALTDGARLRAAAELGNVDMVDGLFIFNCPLRPADEEDEAYC